MKIKPRPRGKIRKSSAYHHWEQPELPRSRGRLGQLNKSNQRAKVKSEFILMAERLDDAPTKR